MKSRIVMCPTMREATLTWKWAQDRFPDVWLKSNKSHLSLLCINGIEYLFKSKTQGSLALRGYHGRVISMNEFMTAFNEWEEHKNEQ